MSTHRITLLIVGGAATAAVALPLASASADRDHPEDRAVRVTGVDDHRAGHDDHADERERHRHRGRHGHRGGRH